MIDEATQPASRLQTGEGRQLESDYYKGESGSEYFAWQNRSAAPMARMEARKFSSHIRSSDVVLDFGCGGGHILRELVCARRVGVEVNPAARAVARQQGIECYPSLADVTDDTCNVIISNHALEHVEHPIGTIRSLRQKLVPSGKLVLYLPLDDWRTQRTYDPADVNHHLHTWTPQLLGNSLFEAGFQPKNFSVRIVNQAFFPGITATYGSVPEPLLDVLCRIFSIALKRRQLMVVATK